MIIPTRGRPEQAAAAARSALAQKLPAGWSREVLVVDDGGSDATRQALPKGARYAWQEHAGPAAARNHGARLAKGELLAFLDSDTLAQPGWLAAGARHRGFVEGRVLPDREAGATPFTEVVQNPSGGRWLTCNLFVPKKDFLALGGFDERFKRPVREDSEFAFRAMEAGHRFRFEPKALVTHPVRETAPERFFYHAEEGMYEALIRRAHPQAYRRHFKWLDGRAIPAYYWAHYVALPAALLDPKAAVLAWALGAAALAAAWSRRRRLSPASLIRLIIPALFVPYARLAWVLLGEFRHPQSPE